MTIDFAQMLALGLLSASLHWIIARSKITKPLWSRAPGLLGDLLRCPACSGFWLGMALEAIGVRPLGGVRLFFAVLLTGVLGAALTPIFQAVMLWSLERTAIEEDEGGS